MGSPSAKGCSWSPTKHGSLATETTLEQQTRLDGFTVLLYHDVLEDTNDDTLHCNGGEVLVHPKDAGRKPCDNSF